MAKKNPFRQSGGWIAVYCGPMFSGKTEALLTHANRMRYARSKVVVFRPEQDTRAAEPSLKSRDGRIHKSVTVQSSKNLKTHFDKMKRKPKAVYIDEVQFFDKDIVKVANEMANSGCIVVCAGLDTDFRGEPFGPMPGLLAVAEKVHKLSAVCVICGSPATRSQRLINGKSARYDDQQIKIGDKETYEPRCRTHHSVSPVAPDEHEKTTL